MDKQTDRHKVNIWNIDKQTDMLLVDRQTDRYINKQIYRQLD